MPILKEGQLEVISYSAEQTQRLGARLGMLLQPGDLVTLFSDGVVEARNRQGELLGFERLQAIVGAGPRSDAAAMVAHIGAQVEAFAEGMPQHDDSTIVVLRLRGDAQ